MQSIESAIEVPPPIRPEKSSEQSGGAAAHCDRQLMQTLTKMTADHAANKNPKAREEGHNPHSEEGILQREMLNDPRFGSPLLCDVVVMLLALVPLLCGLKEYFSPKSPAVALGGFHYGLTLCGIFIFLLGLRSASIHLINQADTTEERVLYILDKFGGSLWIPRIPDVLQIDGDPALAAGGPGGGPGPVGRASSADEGEAAAASASARVYKLVLDPVSASVFQLSDLRDKAQQRPPTG